MKISEFENEEAKSSLNLRLIPLEATSGGTCNAYMARLLGKKVFVKEIKPEFADDVRMLMAFRKESEIGFRLDHYHLPKYIYAEGILPSEKYIVQEFIDGLPLSDFIKENNAYFRNKQNLKRFVRELTDVIDYLHQNGIVHLDLKPENIIITRVGQTLKLVDLGFCASDFYDDTRGFTRSELAPEGLSEPGNRGKESDYYGIGKILRYIHSHTPGLTGRGVRKLEILLLHPDLAKRLSSKEEIEKILARDTRVRRRWLLGSSALIVSAIVLFLIRLISVKDSQNAPADEMRENRELSTVEPPRPDNYIEDNSKETTNINIPKESRQEVPAMLRTGEEHLLPQNRESNISAQNLFSHNSYERLKVEMEENINKNFESFEKMLTAYLHEGKFTANDYKTVIDSYNASLHKTFETTPYKAKYKDLSPEFIDDTMAELFQEIEKENWGPTYKKYVQEYQASESGSSK